MTHPTPQHLLSHLRAQISSGTILPGDCILYRYAHPTCIQRLIAHLSDSHESHERHEREAPGKATKPARQPRRGSDQPTPGSPFVPSCLRGSSFPASLPCRRAPSLPLFLLSILLPARRQGSPLCVSAPPRDTSPLIPAWSLRS